MGGNEQAAAGLGVAEPEFYRVGQGATFRTAAFRDAHDHGVICSREDQAVSVTGKIPVGASRDASLGNVFFNAGDQGHLSNVNPGGATEPSTISRQ